MVWTTTISSKGQLVLPKAIRDELDVKPGDKVVFVKRQGRIELQTYRGDILSWYGAQPVNAPQDWKAIQAEVRQHQTEEIIRESEGN